MANKQLFSVPYPEDGHKQVADPRSCNDHQYYILYVVGIPPDFNSNALGSLFGKCGVVQKVTLLSPKGPWSGKAGFVEFATAVGMTKALEMYHHFDIGKFTLRAKIADRKESRKEKGHSGLPSPADAKPSKLHLMTLKESARWTEQTRKQKPVGNQKDSLMSSCSTCGKKNCVPTCGDCKSVFYCGSACQKQDWAVHKKVCRILREVSSKNEFLSVKNGLASSREDLSQKADSIMESVDALIQSTAKEDVCVQFLANLVKGMVPLGIRSEEIVVARLIEILPSGILYFQRLWDNETVQHQIAHSMNSFYSHCKNQAKAKDVKQGHYYACQYSVDQLWYRVFVQDIYHDGSICNIWYIDYGNCENVPAEKLMNLDQSFLPMPALSTRCKLAGCAEVKASDVRAYILEHQENSEVELEVVGILNSVAEVQMYASIGGEKVLMNKLILEEFMPQEKLPGSHAALALEDMDIVPGTAQFQNVQKSQDRIEAHSTMEHERDKSVNMADNISAADSSYGEGMLAINGVGQSQSLKKFKPNQEVPNSCVLLQEKGIQPHSSSEKLDHESVLKDVKVCSEEASNFDNTILPAKIPVGIFDAVITHVNSEEDISVATLDSVLTTLKALQEELDVDCDENAALNPSKHDRFCAAKSSTWPGWFRAEVLSRTAEDEMLVRFLDYGNTELVKATNTCPLPSGQKYWKVEAQVIPCRLKGHSKGSAEYNEECMRLLKQCENCPLRAEIDSAVGESPHMVTIAMDDSVTVNEYIASLKEELDGSSGEKVQSLNELSLARETNDLATQAGSVLSNSNDSSNDVSNIPVVSSGEAGGLQITETETPSLVSDCLSQPNENTPAADYDVECSAVMRSPTPVTTSQTLLMSNNGKSESVRTVTQFPSSPTENTRSVDCEMKCTTEFSPNIAETVKRSLLVPSNEESETSDRFLLSTENHSPTDCEEQHSVERCAPYSETTVSTLVTSKVKGSENVQTTVQVCTASENSLLGNCEIKCSINPSTVPSDTANIEPAASEALQGNIAKIPTVDIVLGKVYHATLVHAVSPNEFYCQIIDNDTNAERLLERLHQGDIVSEISDGERQFHNGDTCLALASDKHWYRAVIMDVLPSDSQYLVYYIDFGNKEIVSLGDLKSVPVEFTNFKAQAIRCGLDSCFPLRGRWNEQAVGIMEMLINQKLVIEFVRPGEKGYIVKVQLGEESLSSCLIDHDLATEERTLCEVDAQPLDGAIAEDLPGRLEVGETSPAVKHLPNDVEMYLKRGDLVQIRVRQAKNPDDMTATVTTAANGGFSIRCKVNSMEPARGEAWPQESESVLMAFARALLDARVVRIEKDKPEPVVVLQIPVLMNGLILAGLALISL